MDSTKTTQSDQRRLVFERPGLETIQPPVPTSARRPFRAKPQANHHRSHIGAMAGLLQVFLISGSLLITTTGSSGQPQAAASPARGRPGHLLVAPPLAAPAPSASKFLNVSSGTSQVNLNQQYRTMHQSFARNLSVFPGARQARPSANLVMDPSSHRALGTNHLSLHKPAQRPSKELRPARLAVAERRDSPSQPGVNTNVNVLMNPDNHNRPHQQNQQPQQQQHKQHKQPVGQQPARMLICYYTTRQTAPYWPKGAQEFVIPADRVMQAGPSKVLISDQLAPHVDQMLHYEPYPSASEPRPSTIHQHHTAPGSAAHVELEFSSSPSVGSLGGPASSHHEQLQAKPVAASGSGSYYVSQSSNHDYNGEKNRLQPFADALPRQPALNDLDNGPGAGDSQLLPIMSPVSSRSFGNNGADSLAAKINKTPPPPPLVLMLGQPAGVRLDTQPLANNGAAGSGGGPLDDHPNRGPTTMMMIKQQPQQLIFAPHMGQRTINTHSGALVAMDVNGATTASAPPTAPTTAATPLSPPPPPTSGTTPQNNDADNTRQHLFVPSSYKPANNRPQHWPAGGSHGLPAAAPLSYRNMNHQQQSTTLGANQAAAATNQRLTGSPVKFSSGPMASNSVVRFPAPSASSSTPFIASPSTVAAAVTTATAAATASPATAPLGILNNNDNNDQPAGQLNGQARNEHNPAYLFRMQPAQAITTPLASASTTTALPADSAPALQQQVQASLAPLDSQAAPGHYQQLATASTASIDNQTPATSPSLASIPNQLVGNSNQLRQLPSAVAHKHTPTGGGLSTALVSSPLATMFDVFGAASHYLMRFKPSSLMSPSSYSSLNGISGEPISASSSLSQNNGPNGGDGPQQQQHHSAQANRNSSLLAAISLPFSSGLLGSVHKPPTGPVTGPNDRSSGSSVASGGLLSRLSLQTNQRREDICGQTIQTPERRIIGGEGARYGEFPYQVHIKIAKHQCGGALVDRQSIVTAAHCVYHFITRAPVSKLQIVIGAYDIEDEQYQELPPQYFKVNKVKLHPNFRFSASHPDRYDVAILKLDKPVKYTDNVLPVCLPSKDLKFESLIGTVTGFGKTDPSLSNRYGTRLLQKVDVPIIENNECERWHRTRGIDLKIFPEMMCAGYEDGLKDACVGDSGGPLVVKTPVGGPNGSFRWTLAGITSAGFGCAQSRQPGIYHRVSHTVDWILENLD